MDDNVNPFAAEPVHSPDPSPALSRTTSHSSSQPSRYTASSPPPTQRASFPDPSKPPRGAGASRQTAGPKPKTDFCCERDRQIARGDEISIVDAFKTTEGGKSSYITYVIRLGNYTTRRRYSSFLSLHQALTGLYPVLIIPPIPSKQAITDYAIKGQSKTKEDMTTIAKRKRLLEDFLGRIVRHPILGGEHVFHRFLEDGVSWSEVVHSPPISLLPKNPLHAPSHNPTFQEADGSDDPSTSSSYIAHHLLPNPSPTHPLHRPDQRFQESELFTDRFQQHFQGTMEKVNRRVAKRWGERATDMSELGAQWNGFSLTESGELGNAIEKVGQAVDADYLATTQLLSAWEVDATEPLHIYTQFGSLIRSRLSFRHQKHVQYELVQEALENQRDKLELLQAAERESRRLEQALERGGGVGSTSPTSVSSPEGGAASAAAQDEDAPSRPAARRGQPSFGLLSAVKHSLSGMMDVDPESTRRTNIGKTRDNISQLEDSLQASAQDLKYASTTLQADLDRFQRQKVADLRQLAIELSTMHREWCRQNLEAWKTAQTAIREIPDHPNTPPPGTAVDEPSSEPQQRESSESNNSADLVASMDRELPPVPDNSASALAAASSTPAAPSASVHAPATSSSSGFVSTGLSGTRISGGGFSAAAPVSPVSPTSPIPSSPFTSDPLAADPLAGVTPVTRTTSNGPRSPGAKPTSPVPSNPATPPVVSPKVQSPVSEVPPKAPSPAQGGGSDPLAAAEDKPAAAPAAPAAVHDDSVGPLGPL